MRFWKAGGEEGGFTYIDGLAPVELVGPPAFGLRVPLLLGCDPKKISYRQRGAELDCSKVPEIRQSNLVEELEAAGNTGYGQELAN